MAFSFDWCCFIIYQIVDVDNDIAIIQGVSYRVKKRISVTSVEACSSKDLYNELEKENDAIKKIKFSSKLPSKYPLYRIPRANIARP